MDGWACWLKHTHTHGNTYPHAPFQTPMARVQVDPSVISSRVASSELFLSCLIFGDFTLIHVTIAAKRAAKPLLRKKIYIYGIHPCSMTMPTHQDHPRTRMNWLLVMCLA